jgi:hypothetical protein
MCNISLPDSSTTIAVLSLFVSITAVIATYITLRYQVFSMINTQFADKAREANANLNSRGELSADLSCISGILSAIITARQLFNYHLNHKGKNILIRVNKQAFFDQFYLQLGTSIREYLQADKFNPDNITIPTPKIDNLMKDQFASCKEFLKNSIEKDSEGGEFSKL